MWAIELLPCLLPALGRKWDLYCKCSQNKQNQTCGSCFTAAIQSHWRDPDLSPTGKVNSGQYRLLCPDPPPCSLCLDISILEKQRETQVGAGYRLLLRGWVLRSEAFSGFRVQLYTPEIHNRKVKPVPTCSEEQSLRGKDSVFLAGGKVLVTCTTRTSTTPSQWCG